MALRTGSNIKVQGQTQGHKCIVSACIKILSCKTPNLSQLTPNTNILCNFHSKQFIQHIEGICSIDFHSNRTASDLPFGILTCYACLSAV